MRYGLAKEGKTVPGVDRKICVMNLSEDFLF